MNMEQPNLKNIVKTEIVDIFPTLIVRLKRFQK